MQWFLKWWLNPSVLAQLQVITGLAGGVLAGFAIYFAWKVAKRQFTMMGDQDRLMNRHVKLAKRQADSLKRQEVLSAEIKGLTESQAKIAETQHKIFQEQLNRRADLALEVRSEPEGTILSGTAHYHLFVRNTGNKACHELRWALLIPVSFAHRFEFSIKVDEFDPPDDTGWQVRKVTGLLREVLFPGEENMILSFTVKKDIEEPVTISVNWKVVSEDGRYPEGDEFGGFRLDVKSTFPPGAFSES